MKPNLMNGTYYEIVGGMEEDIIVNVNKTNLNDKLAAHEAAITERIAYKNTYENGIRTKVKSLYDPYGDGYFPIDNDVLHYEPLPYELQHRYRMLSRLKIDCDYFLGNGYGCEKHLWTGSVEDQIAEMKRRWNEFEDDEKPEWLSKKDIDNYELEMLEAREKRNERVS